MKRYPVQFVGAGPGDPELVTVKGKRLLQEADRVVYAGSLVPAALLDHCRPETEQFDSASLTLEQTHDLLARGHEDGLRVVRLHTGDPALYGAIQEQMELLDKASIPYRVTPGVTAVFAAAAELRQELTLPEVSQTVILTRLGGRTPVPPRENLASLASHGATLAIYLSVHDMEGVVEELGRGYEAETPVVVAYRVGWPDQTLVKGTLADIVQKVRRTDIRRQAIILVGPVLQAREKGNVKPSRLYDASFSHGFRHARSDS